MKLKNQNQADIETFYNNTVLLLLILVTGLLEKEFHIYTMVPFLPKKITLRVSNFAGTNFCKDSNFKYFAGIKFHEFRNNCCGN